MTQGDWQPTAACPKTSGPFEPNHGRNAGSAEPANRICPVRRLAASTTAKPVTTTLLATTQATAPVPNSVFLLCTDQLQQCRHRLLTHSANLCVETALVASSLVLVNKALASHVIKNRRCFFKRSFGSAFVSSSDCCENALNHSTHHRALARVALTRFFGLANAFACLSSVGHGLSSSLSVLNSAAHYPPGVPLSQLSLS